ncbi:MAG TPA: diacylglycerol kinase family protein [Stellaceae bacterium]
MSLPASSRRLLVIFNPTAGARRRRRLDRVLAELARLGCAVTLRATQARGDAEAFARAADPNAVDLVVAAGGDGTINEIINGLARSSLPLALIPLGTANVLAREIGLPRAPRRIARAIASGTPLPVYPGLANGRRFVMMAGIGIDARIVQGIAPRLKRAGGKLAYVVSGIQSILRDRGPRYRVTIDGVPDAAAAIIIAKGHFYGGRFVVARAARLDTPSLHAVLMARPGRWNIVRYGVAIALGRLDRLPDVRVIEARRVTIAGPSGEAVQADGDLVATLPLTVTVAETPLLLVH